MTEPIEIARSRGIHCKRIPVKESVERDEKKKLLGKQMVTLESKIRRERQFNRQIAMNTELKGLRKGLEVL